jgi:HAE1 family hydrophobic/amphiphilic exporter-1
VLQKRLENVRGVGSVSVVGGTKREINIYLCARRRWRRWASRIDQVVAALRSENQELPLGAIRSREQERVVQINARMKRPEFRRHHRRAAQRRRPVRCGRWPTWSTARRRVESLALYNGQRTVLLSVQKSQGENTIAVVDGLRRAGRCREAAAARRATEINRDNSRHPRVGGQRARTLIEGAVLTMLIVFLFLNSWRSTVITGLTLPIALIGTFLFMNLFGFTINMITLMALSLCVGLLIDDAIVVRENIVRHVQMGKSAHDAALDGTQEIGLAVLATTLSIVAVFLPIGFMGGIIGKFFHEFGITIVAAVLISMFVSFTLDPMLSSVWHDPSIDSPRPPPRRSRCTTRPSAASPAGSTASPTGWPTPTRASWLVAGAQAGRWAGAGHLRRQLLHGAAAGHRVRAQGRLFRDHSSTSTRRWARRWR